MNKITSTLAGLAIVATASVAPAFAQGNLFNPPGNFTFFFSGAGNNSFFATSQSVGFNPAGGGATTTAAFSLTGTRVDSTNIFNVTSLVISPTNDGVFVETNPLQFLVSTLPSGSTFVGSLGASSDGTSINLSSPVPEASTVISFGALLALGGLAVLRRKGVKNAA